MKKSHIILLIIIAVAIGAIFSTFADSSTYGNFDEAQENGTEIHVVGKLVKSKEMTYDPVKDANYFAFYLTDNKGKECKVIFSGTKPQDFERSEQIVITGKMSGEEFHASKILMKCPSKYTNDKVETKEYKAS
jgi:cytochrome c-type biogenesis protein CcmE